SEVTRMHTCYKVTPFDTRWTIIDEFKEENKIREMLLLEPREKKNTSLLVRVYDSMVQIHPISHRALVKPAVLSKPLPPLPAEALEELMHLQGWSNAQILFITTAMTMAT